MRIAFVGKGGSGKTTAAAAFSRHLAAQGRRVVSVDADINQHLGAALGYAGPPPRAMGAELSFLKEHLRGTNPRLPRAAEMIKTTPPGRGSRLLDLDPDDTLLRRFAVATPEGVRCWRRARSRPTTSAWPATTPRRARWSSTSTTSSTGPASTWWWT